MADVGDGSRRAANDGDVVGRAADDGDRSRRAADDGDRSRAQLMLVGGLALAVMLVALALVLNSVIFTENLATRNVGSDVREATEFRRVTYGTVAGSIVHVNDVYRGDDFATLYRDEYRPVLRNVSARTSRAESVSGTSTDVDDVFGHPGTQIVDDNESTLQTFTPRSGSIVNWTVAKNVTFRRFRVTPNKDNLSQVSLSSVKDTVRNEESLVFFIKITDRRNRHWYVGIWRQSDEMHVITYNDSADTFSQVCSSPATEATLDFARQRFDGRYCSAFEFTEDIEGKTAIEYWNGDLAAGTYRLFVDRAQESLRDVVNTANYGNQCDLETYYRPSDNASPYTAPAVYSTVVNATYRSSSARYQGEIYVEPDPIGPDAVAPTVTVIDVTDGSASDGNFTVTWNTSDPTNDPVTVALELYDDSDLLSASQVDGATGLAPSGTRTLSNSSVSLIGTYTIVVVASDDRGNERTVTQVHEDDGDDSGCVP